MPEASCQTTIHGDVIELDSHRRAVLQLAGSVQASNAAMRMVTSNLTSPAQGSIGMDEARHLASPSQHQQQQQWSLSPEHSPRRLSNAESAVSAASIRASPAGMRGSSSSLDIDVEKALEELVKRYTGKSLTAIGEGAVSNEKARLASSVTVAEATTVESSSFCAGRTDAGDSPQRAASGSSFDPQQHMTLEARYELQLDAVADALCQAVAASTLANTPSHGMPTASAAPAIPQQGDEHSDSDEPLGPPSQAPGGTAAPQPLDDSIPMFNNTRRPTDQSSTPSTSPYVLDSSAPRPGRGEVDVSKRDSMDHSMLDSSAGASLSDRPPPRRRLTDDGQSTAAPGELLPASHQSTAAPSELLPPSSPQKIDRLDQPAGATSHMDSAGPGSPNAPRGMRRYDSLLGDAAGSSSKPPRSTSMRSSGEHPPDLSQTMGPGNGAPMSIRTRTLIRELIALLASAAAAFTPIEASAAASLNAGSLKSSKASPSAVSRDVGVTSPSSLGNLIGAPGLPLWTPFDENANSLVSAQRRLSTSFTKLKRGSTSAGVSAARITRVDSAVSMTAAFPARFTENAVVSDEDFDGTSTINQYVLLNSIGRGAQGEVMLAMDTSSNELRAVKVIHRPAGALDLLNLDATGDDASEETAVRGVRSTLHRAKRQKALLLQREIAAMKRCRHRNVVSLYEVIDDPAVDALYLVMQYVEHGSLVKMSRSGAPSQTVSPDKLAIYARQLCAGLQYLHNHGIVHRDIKPDNILLGANEVVFWSDFGVAEVFDLKPAASTSKDDTASKLVSGTQGTSVFFAPELLDVDGEAVPEAQPDGAAGEGVDVWALGLTFYVLLYGNLPWPADSTVAAYFDHVLRSPISFPKISSDGTKLDADWPKLLESMLQRDPKKRSTLAEAREIVRRLSSTAEANGEAQDDGKPVVSKVAADPQSRNHRSVSWSRPSRYSLSGAPSATAVSFRRGTMSISESIGASSKASPRRRLPDLPSAGPVFESPPSSARAGKPPMPQASASVGDYDVATHAVNRDVPPNVLVMGPSLHASGALNIGSSAKYDGDGGSGKPVAQESAPPTAIDKPPASPPSMKGQQQLRRDSSGGGAGRRGSSSAGSPLSPTEVAESTEYPLPSALSRTGTRKNSSPLRAPSTSTLSHTLEGSDLHHQLSEHSLNADA